MVPMDHKDKTTPESQIPQGLRLLHTLRGHNNWIGETEMPCHSRKYCRVARNDA